MKTIKNKMISIALLSILFMFLYIFYTQVHPIVIRNGDDWTYISTSRETALPSFKEWNPARIFPETFLPFISNIAVYQVYPVTNDYIGSFTIMCALVMASTITLYIFSFYRLVIEKFALSEMQGGMLSFLFFLLHYLIFISDGCDNPCLFMIYDVTNGFYYTIPALLNLILIFLIERKPDIKKYQYYKNHPFESGILILLLYMAIFSNLFSSYLLAIYAGVNLLYDLVFARWNKRNRFGLWVQQRITCFLVLGLWLVEAYFDNQGSRAANARKMNELPFGVSMKATLLNLKNQLSLCNKFIFFIIIIFVLLLTIILFKEKESAKQVTEVVLKYFAIILLAMIYLVLLSAMVHPSYVARMDVLIGPISLFIMCIFSVFAYVWKKYSGIMTVVPLISYILICSVLGNVDGRVINDLKNPKSYVALENYYIEQFRNADKNKVTEFILDASSDAPYYLGDRIAMTLYKHGIVSRLMTVKTRKNADVDAMFDLR